LRQLIDDLSIFEIPEVKRWLIQHSSHFLEKVMQLEENMSLG